ncbi:type II secretion system protein E [Mycoplasma sp. CAG:776]|nr:type II secretion system protein E [Mycoplasma sp. CAG:776]
MRTFDFENLSIVEVVNEIIVDAIRKKASDIHFDPIEECLMVRIRIDGELQDYTKIPNILKKNVITRIKIISGMNITETRMPQDGAIKNMIEQTALDLRVSSLPCVMGEKMVIRILDYSMSLNGLENLGFSDTNLKRLEEMIKKPNGLILVTGATGTGKSTTVYAILQKLNTKERNIITVEDPVEMKIKNINQVQVLNDIGLNFSHTLRSILRQDPDIIMVGEIRDNETARIAVRASITGHLVLSTVHTNNSLTTIERLIDMEVERYLLGSALTGIVSQKLVKKLCPKCRKTRPTTPYEKKLIKKHLGTQVNEVYTPVGCECCNHGYLGRIAIHEVLSINEEIREAITANVDRKTLKDLVYHSKKDITTSFEDGLTKVIEGLTSMEEIMKTVDVESDEELVA